MPSRRRGLTPADTAVLVVFAVWLVAIPLPFGSVIDRAQPWLILPPLVLATVAALLRVAREHRSVATASYRIAVGGAAAFAAIVLLQLVPLAPPLLARLSPQSLAIWSRAANLAALLQHPIGDAHPITLDPPSTWLHFFRFGAYVGAFATAALVARRHRARVLLAAALCASATFQALYGFHEAALQRYAIWGWRNDVIFGRVTGTFVNPNHFAHYAAIVVPMALFLVASAWHDAAPPGTRVRHHLLRLLERRFFLFSLAACAGLACVVAILIAQSRGALLALAVGIIVTGAMVAIRAIPRHHAAIAVAAGIVAGALLLGGLAWLLGLQRSVERMTSRPDEAVSIGGRRATIVAAARIWQRFPVFGSGFGTFERVSPMVQREHPEYAYNHAHDDYIELAATTGAAGLAIGLVSLIGVYVTLYRMTFRVDLSGSMWYRVAFQCAALASLTIAIVHALIDFNFFIPANPATLAAIVGAAVGPRVST